MSVLVVIEHDRGALAAASLEALAFAGDIASQLGVAVEALGIGAATAELADVCGANGASECTAISAPAALNAPSGDIQRARGSPKGAA